jgi:hypothetical protein
LGDLTLLYGLDLSLNKLEGEIPASLTNLTGLSLLDLGYNMLYALDPGLADFLNLKDPNWDQTQTVGPTNIQVASVTSSSVGLTWTPIHYTGDGGYYEIGYSEDQGGPYSFVQVPGNKTASGGDVSALQPGTTYYFVVRTFTPAHGVQQNALTSSGSTEVSATTSYLVPNDDIEDAFVISTSPYANSQDTQGATMAADDPVLGCGPANQGYNTVWYRYTPAENGIMTIDTFGSEFNTVLAVWTGPRGSLAEKGCNDDAGAGEQSQIELYAYASETYHIEVAGFSLSDDGNLDLSFRFSPGIVTCDVVSEIPYAECDALKAFYESTNATTWGDWFETDTPCSWLGITCSGNHVADLSLDSKGITGTIPDELENLSYLEVLDLQDNGLSGGIPSNLGNLSNLIALRLDLNQLAGEIPINLGNLGDLETLSLSSNHLTGGIPPEVSGLSSIKAIDLSSNQLGSSLPTTICILTTLETGLGLSNNAFEGEIPACFADLTNLTSWALDLGYNKLWALDAGLLAFLEVKDPDWDETQTVAPGDLQITSFSGITADLAWTPIAYSGDGGYYEVWVGTSPGGPYSLAGTTADKLASSYVLTGLSPDVAYYIVIRTYTPQHGNQANELWSDFSDEVQRIGMPYPIWVPLVMK